MNTAPINPALCAGIELFMTIVLTIIAVIVIFSLLVLVHEYGHFAAARRAGVRVLEFGFGFPPRLFKKKVGETTYSLNAIPFGGFVKLYGEDSTDPAVLHDKESFAHQTKWVRAKIILAGVFMNFLLAILLLTIGFIFGIEPLLVNQEDLYASIQSGIVKTAPGAYIEKADDRLNAVGLATGDQIVSVDDVPVTTNAQLAIFAKKGAQKDADITVKKKEGGTLAKIHLPLIDGNSLGLQLKPVTSLPRLAVYEVKAGGASASAGLQRGDTILSVNGKEVYGLDDFYSEQETTKDLHVTVLRDQSVRDLTITQDFAGRVVIATVFKDSAAEKAGFLANDRLLAINGATVTSAEEVQNTVAEANGAEKEYQVLRDGQTLTLKARVEPKARLGIALSEVAFYAQQDLSLYVNGVVTSMLEIGHVKLAPWAALKQALSESVRLTGVTIAAFGKTLRSLVSGGAVPSDIGGPVQIAYYTHTFVQEGFFALLRFTALLSLSLAVMNVLPIPALDGGRLFFIIVEAITRRKVSPKLEAFVHGLGFILLMLLILAITYSDIMKLI